MDNGETCQYNQHDSSDLNGSQIPDMARSCRQWRYRLNNTAHAVLMSVFILSVMHGRVSTCMCKPNYGFLCIGCVT